MSLRCRVGEKAVILRGRYIGYIVTIVEYLGNLTGPNLSGAIVSVKDAWEVSCPQLYQLEGGVLGVADEDLQPINPLRPKTGIMDCGR